VVESSPTSTAGEAPELLDAQIEACARSALHLEMRDGYTFDDPMFTAWRAGYRDDQSDPTSWWRPWLDLIQSAIQRGVAVRRARIVSEPVSEYIRFEYDVTFMNVFVGWSAPAYGKLKNPYCHCGNARVRSAFTPRG
jgi:hypothetical protein